MKSSGAFRVTVFGAAHIDRLLRTNGTAVLGASNPGHLRDTVGGVAFNIASALARLGVSTRLVTRLGNDEAGNRVLKAATDAGIGPVWIARSSHFPTATYHAVLDAAGSLVIGVADTHIYDEMTPEVLSDALAAPADLWIADANLSEDSLVEIGAKSRAGGPPLAACAVSPSKVVRFAEMLRDISIWFGNRGEAEAVLGRAYRDAPGAELAAGMIAAGVSSGFVSDGKSAFRRVAPRTDRNAEAIRGRAHIKRQRRGRRASGRDGLRPVQRLELLRGAPFRHGLRRAQDRDRGPGARRPHRIPAGSEDRGGCGKGDGMNPALLAIAPEVAAALAAGKPVVALESTIIAHGMPWPENVDTARAVEAIIRNGGATPATIAVIGGKVRIGLADDELTTLARANDVLKLSRADLPYAIATGRTGATTIAATMICAALAGIRVFGTGGLGGVHRGAEMTFDVSADLTELSRTNVVVVAGGPKALLDLPKTLEVLETLGVPVIGYRTDEFPAFWSRSSGLPIPLRLDTAADIAAFVAARDGLGLEGGVLVANAIPAATRSRVRKSRRSSTPLCAKPPTKAFAARK